MENFNVTISVMDNLCCRCNNISNSTTRTLTSLNDFIPLQQDYYLKLISVTDNYVVISVDNGAIFYVRKAYPGVPIRICLSSCNTNHVVTILVNSIENT